jgi:MscS family membrane protein
MIATIWEKTYYHNTLTDWMQAAAIIIGALVLGKIIYWVIGKTIKKLASKTRTRLDDILVDMLEEPVVLTIIILGIWHGLGTLSFPLPVDDKGVEIKDALTVEMIIDKAIIGLIICNIAWLITRVFDALVEEYLIPFAKKTESDLDDQLVPLIRKAMKISVWVIAIIMAMDNAGLDVFSIMAGLGIGGLAFALAAQETVGNFFGSVAIFIDKPFKVGERIQVHGYDGVVTAVGLRSTRIRTRYQGRIVTIPNSRVARADIVNVESENGRQIFTAYRLTPDMNDQQVEQAMALLKKIAQEDPDTQEKVVTGFYGITEYSRDIMLLYWIRPETSNLKTRTRINLEIIRQFKAHSLELVKANPVHAKLDEVDLV